MEPQRKCKKQTNKPESGRQKLGAEAWKVVERGWSIEEGKAFYSLQYSFQPYWNTDEKSRAKEQTFSEWQNQDKKPMSADLLYRVLSLLCRKYF